MLAAGKTAGEIAVEIKRTRQAVYARMQRLYRKRRKDVPWIPPVDDGGK
jgi:hypothetical protein